VLSLIRSLRDEGVSIILISHTMSDVMEVSDRMVIMRRGKVAANLLREEANTELVVKHMVGA
jgi:ABC-type sugar transport system ATPase subunit